MYFISKMRKCLTCRVTSYFSIYSNSGLEFKGGAKGDAKDISNDHIKRGLKNDVMIQNIQRTPKLNNKKTA